MFARAIGGMAGLAVVGGLAQAQTTSVVYESFPSSMSPATIGINNLFVSRHFESGGGRAPARG
jgi:hypothetical protein